MIFSGAKAEDGGKNGADQHQFPRQPAHPRVDVAKCGVSGTFKGPNVLAAIRGHVLGQALTGVYALNPTVKV
jgi:hypothetical protein